MFRRGQQSNVSNPASKLQRPQTASNVGNRNGSSRLQKPFSFSKDPSLTKASASRSAAVETIELHKLESQVQTETMLEVKYGKDTEGLCNDHE